VVISLNMHDAKNLLIDYGADKHWISSSPLGGQNQSKITVPIPSSPWIQYFLVSNPSYKSGGALVNSMLRIDRLRIEIYFKYV
jgi:hypothetical protein